tara:strand:- start:145 stop:723 length:579 start_codon:yes stop_codon:yes gene_type:complete
MKVIYKKYMKYFILFLIIVTSLYLLFNKFITLENFSNNIVPINSDSETIDYCGSSNPYDNDGIQIKKKQISGCELDNTSSDWSDDSECGYTTNLAIDPDTGNKQDIILGKRFILKDNSDSEMVFQDITSSDYNYYFKTDVKDKMDQNIEVNDIKLSNPESSTTNTHKWVVPIGTNSDSSDHKCKYTYYTKNT